VVTAYLRDASRLFDGRTPKLHLNMSNIRRMILWRTVVHGVIVPRRRFKDCRVGHRHVDAYDI